MSPTPGKASSYRVWRVTFCVTPESRTAVVNYEQDASTAGLDYGRSGLL